MAENKLPHADSGEEATLFPKTAGERLREARESQGLSLAEVAERTRVPIRHLEGIETSNFASLPSPTYAVGFAKAYARAVGVDEVLIGREIRDHRDVTRTTPQYQPYDASDPKRLPPRGLAIAGALLAVIALVGLGLFYGTTLFQGGDNVSPPIAVQKVEPAPAAAPPPTSPATGQVVLTATDLVWLRVYTADKTLYQAELKPGERYEVPVDAVKPMINVGRPDKLTVTVNGSVVPALGTGERAIKDVEISAAALLARAAPAAPTAVETPSASAASPPAAPSRTAEPSRAAQIEGTVRQTSAPSNRSRVDDAEATRRANAADGSPPAAPVATATPTP